MKEMAKVCWYIQMEADMMDISKLMFPMEKVACFMNQEINMMETS